MKEEPKRSEPPGRAGEPDPLIGFLEVRRRWSGPTAPSPEPWRIGAELAEAMDGVIAGLLPDESITAVAVGGYGRGQLCLHSDIDLLVLHDGDLHPDAVKALLYPLWDARLRVGHAVRRVRECASIAGEDLTVLCSLLTSRLVAGPGHRLRHLHEELADVLRGPRAGLIGLLADEEAEVRRGEPFFRQDPDLKVGRGGLRSLDRLGWARARSMLLGEEPGVEDHVEVEARRLLLGVRAALHAVEGRPTDRLPVELRGRVGAWLGREPFDVAGEVCATMRAVDTRVGLAFARARQPGEDPVAARGRQVIGFLRSRWTRPTGAGPSVALGLARRVSRGQARVGPWEFSLLSSAPVPTWTQEDRDALLGILASGQPGWEAFMSLWEAGWVPRALPELVHLHALPQAAPFHRHPVDSHLGRTVAEVLAVAGEERSWWSEWVDGVGSLDELVLAAFLHDAGKGLPGDHSVTGERLGRDLLVRLGFPDSTARLVGRLVRHHLLLPEVAFRRDVDDPQVVAEVAAAVEDTHTLRLLSLLAVADARATGEESWSSWRSGLLSALYGRVESFLGADRSRLEEEERRRLHRLAGPGLSAAQVEAHVGRMPPGYLLRFGGGAVLDHLRLLTPPPGPGEVRIRVDGGAPFSTVTVAAADRPGFLALIAGVLALHNLAVIEARVATRSDGLALDVFTVVDALGGDVVGKARWPQVEEDLARSMAGRLDLNAALARKRADYGATRTPTTRVDVVRGDGVVTVEVRTEDRIGLLHDLASALTGLGLDVAHAKIDTRGSRVVDVFTVHDPHPLSAERDHAIRERLVEALMGRQT